MASAGILDNGRIEQYILDQSDKDAPNICFIPTATGDNEAYKVSYYATMTKLNCNPTHLDFFKRTPDLEKLIQKQDVIFVGGGNTKSMLAVWRDWGLDKILKKAYESGTIMSGVSAGAICWFENNYRLMVEYKNSRLPKFYERKLLPAL